MPYSRQLQDIKPLEAKSNAKRINTLKARNSCLEALLVVPMSEYDETHDPAGKECRSVARFGRGLWHKIDPRYSRDDSRPQFGSRASHRRPGISIPLADHDTYGREERSGPCLRLHEGGGGS